VVRELDDKDGREKDCDASKVGRKGLLAESEE
jgi:hypothetical protein